MSNGPSRNPAGDGSLSGLLNLALQKFLQNTDSCLPAIVVAYSPAGNRASVNPAIVQITTGNDQVPRANLASVPVLQAGGGGFVLYFPVKPGDKGWIIACDRDISIFKQSYQQSAPNTYRVHDFADSWFVPDSMLDGVSLVDSTKMCLQSYDGTMAITMGGGEVNIIAPTSIIFNAPVVTITGVLNAENTGSATDAFTVTGTIRATADVQANSGSISLVNHVHTGVQTGGGNTGPATG